jgi:omega-amidase
MLTHKILNVGLLQFAIEQDKILANAKKLLRSLDTILQKKIDLIVLPEVFLGGPKAASEMQATARVYQDIISELQARAKDSSCAFYGSIIESNKKTFYNSSLYINDAGRVQAVYRKNHLFRFDNEHKRFGAGSKSDVITTRWGKIAPQICYDIRFPELLRKMTFQGAKLALVCAQWPSSRREHWLTLLRARAIENQIFVIACNRRGRKNALTFSGDSCVISPWGDFLLQAQEKSFATCQVDLSLVETVRAQYPFLKDAAKRRIRFDI